MNSTCMSIEGNSFLIKTEPAIPIIFAYTSEEQETEYKFSILKLILLKPLWDVLLKIKLFIFNSCNDKETTGEVKYHSIYKIDENGITKIDKMENSLLFLSRHIDEN